MRFLILTLSVLSSTLSFASDGTNGNGADIVYCPNSSIQAELADVVEARQAYGLEIKNWPGQNYEAKLEAMLVSLGGRMPWRAEQLRAEILAFEADAQRVSDLDLVDVPDTGNINLPEGCKIRQAITQRKPVSGRKRYLIDQNLWELLDENHKAALVLHSVIFKTALENGASNSIGTRRFNALVVSEGLLSLTDLALYELVKELPKDFKNFETRFAYGYVLGSLLNDVECGISKECLKFSEAGTFLTGSFREGKVRSKVTEFPFSGEIEIHQGGYRIKARDAQVWYRLPLSGSEGVTVVFDGQDLYYIDEEVCGPVQLLDDRPDCASSRLLRSMNIKTGKIHFQSELGAHILTSATGTIVYDRRNESVSWNFPAGELRINVPAFGGYVISPADPKRWLGFIANGEVRYVFGQSLRIHFLNGALNANVNGHGGLNLFSGETTDLRSLMGTLQIQGQTISLDGQDMRMHTNETGSALGFWSFTTNQDFYLFDAQGNRWFVPGAQKGRVTVTMDNNGKIVRYN